MSLRFLPIGSFLYLIGGMVFGFGIGFAAIMPGYVSLVSTGVGSLTIVAGYFTLRPLFRRAKAEIKARSKASSLPAAAPGASGE
ncbi:MULTISPECIES: hypothetical protein [Burkholderia]|jgi:hypothetical protein|uniref:Uncharacterized protein n=2 Tax=Burkholderia cepacia complex TaxID=87882 RepID=A0A1E3FQ42_9BURK|nr:MULTISPECIES: hypothetical protein [Burkholderia]ELK7724820.1 hypothetical protein [Burkholderia cenocepacia]UTP27785.1 hypothetical protein NMB33_40580 [Burkholderia sp. FXe9]HBN6128655.1 hypothetical protein [Clostridioides difficile]MBA9833444.1 hypothetical protein [Burkholderia contaminans]MBH9693719.1 hypothetical protein [Burkholderia contaminans]